MSPRPAAGRALLLVHGLTASHAVWEPTLEAFADRWRVIAPDLPGHGESAKPDAPYTIDFFAGMVRSLARDARGAGGGGLRQLARRPRRARAGACAIRHSPARWSWPRRRSGTRPRCGRSVRRSRRSPARASCAPASSAVLPAELPRPHAASVTSRAAASWRSGWRRPDFPEFARAVARSLGGVLRPSAQPLERVTQPVLVVWGRRTAWCRCGAARACCAGSRTPGCTCSSAVATCRCSSSRQRSTPWWASSCVRHLQRRAAGTAASRESPDVHPPELLTGLPGPWRVRVRLPGGSMRNSRSGTASWSAARRWRC